MSLGEAFELRLDLAQDLFRLILLLCDQRSLNFGDYLSIISVGLCWL